MDQPPSKRTHPGSAHREDICLCFLSNCAATQSDLRTQAYSVVFSSYNRMISMWLVMKESGPFQKGVFPIMQITFQIFTSFHPFGRAAFEYYGKASGPPLHI